MCVFFNKHGVYKHIEAQIQIITNLVMDQIFKVVYQGKVR